ncbi:MAG: DUF262 domain-containing HNH endonuclease family protein [Chloroflexota bacterium]
MAQKIESDKLLVNEVFKKWYRIPEYQRPYVWEPDQVLELLEDVYSARQSNPESQYFLGSLVLKKTEKHEGTTKYEEYDLLDGQQRLTTLFLITAVIRDLTPTTNEARLKACKETIFQMANPDDNVPERIRIVFDIRDKVKNFIDNYVKKDDGTKKINELKGLSEKKDEDINIRNMAKAILTIRDYFNNGKSIDDFFPYLRSNVLMIYVASEELEDAFHLFTVMNNRGIRLRNSDILKAENLAKIKNLDERIRYAKVWESIEEDFGEAFDNFLSHLRTILVKQRASYNLLREYEESIYSPREFDRITKTYSSKPALLEKGEQTFKFIEQYAQDYNVLFSGNNFGLNNSYELDNYMSLMDHGLDADYWIPPLLRYYNKFNSERLLDFVRVLDQKISSDFITGISPTTRIDNANAILKHIDNAPDTNTALSSDVYKLNATDLIRVLSGNSIYGRRYARYLLLKLDLIHHGHTTRLDMPPTISIEHILPQTPDAKSQWVRDFDEKERDIWTDRLGNLILLSRKKNSAQGNLDFSEKKTKYFKSNIELFSNSVRIFNAYSTWGLPELQTNHLHSLKKLMDSYGVDVSDEALKKAME